MKTRSFLFLIVFCTFLLNGFAQEQEPGTAPAGYGGGRDIRANGLTEIFSVSGHYYLSADGAGSTASSYTIDVNKPSATATVFKAYFMGLSQGFSGFNIPNGCITLSGNPISWNTTLASSISSFNHYADVTTLIAPIMNPAPVGITSLAVTECGPTDGTSLLVIFADPASPEETIVILFGACSTTGDNFNITLGTPIDPIVPGALLDMGLGISFGFQGSTQYSRIDINGARLTTSAGGGDDARGTIANSSLITVGGIGDLNTNPANPFAFPVNHFSDDELYSLLPYIDNTVTNILVNTLNPSNDDNIFLSYFEISGVAIIGEGILLSQTEDTNFVGTDHTVMALVQDNLGVPVVGTLVDFTVISGPNAGETYSEVTDADGHAFFTYAGTGGVGTDEIEACFTDSQGVYGCSNILEKEWIEGDGPPVPLSNWALVIGIMLILGAAIIRFRR